MEESYVPELLSGVFTVKAATETEPAKTVKFTKGNLFWNGSEYRCEDTQYAYPTTREASHIGHFFWSKDAAVAVASTYSDSEKTTTDKFFAADGGAIEGFTVLSNAEWSYLFEHSLAKNSSSKNTITIDDKKCIVLKPDGFSGTVADSYTAEQWITAEASGLVALPFAGYYFGSSISGAGSNGSYWSSTPDSSNAGRAWCALFDSDLADTDDNGRNHGLSVRLVSVVE